MTHAAEPFGSSVITLAEAYAGATRAGQADRLGQLLARLEITPLELPAASARRLGELRASTGLKMPDCCVLFTAERHDAAVAHLRQETRCPRNRDRIARRADNLTPLGLR